MIALVAAAISAIASASSVSWGLNSSLDTEKFTDGSKLYLFAAASIADLTDFASKTSEFTLDNVKTALGADLAVLNTAPNNLNLESGKAASNGNTVTTYGDSKTGYYKVFTVAIANDGKSIAVANSPIQLNIRNTATPANAMFSASNMTVYSAVPEPTSGLLVLLGIASMALRRRHS